MTIYLNSYLSNALANSYISSTFHDIIKICVELTFSRDTFFPADKLLFISTLVEDSVH